MVNVREMMGAVPKPPKDDTEELLDADFDDFVDCERHRFEVLAGIAECDAEIKDYGELRIQLLKDLTDLDESLVEARLLYGCQKSTTGRKMFRHGTEFRMLKGGGGGKVKHPGAGIFRIVGK